MTKTKAKKILNKFYKATKPKGLKSIDLKIVEKDGKILIFDLMRFKNERNFDYSYLIIEDNKIVFDCADGEKSKAEIFEIFQSIDINQKYDDLSFEIVEDGNKIEIVEN